MEKDRLTVEKEIAAYLQEIASQMSNGLPPPFHPETRAQLPNIASSDVFGTSRDAARGRSHSPRTYPPLSHILERTRDLAQDTLPTLTQPTPSGKNYMSL